MKTDLEHYNKTLPELQKRKRELHNELCKSMSLKKYKETHSLLQSSFFKDIASCEKVKLKKLEQIGDCKTQDHCLLNDGDLDIIINNKMLDDNIIDVAMKLVMQNNSLLHTHHVTDTVSY